MCNNANKAQIQQKTAVRGDAKLLSALEYISFPKILAMLFASFSVNALKDQKQVRPDSKYPQKERKKKENHVEINIFF